MPDISISTDIIVGFPGEAKAAFNKSVAVFKKARFDMAYINKYSPRPGTAAYSMEDDVSKAEKSRREKVLTDILRQTALKNNQKLLGKIIPALIIKKGKNRNAWLGKTGGNKTILIESSTNLRGKFINAGVTQAFPWGLRGKISNSTID